MTLFPQLKTSLGDPNKLHHAHFVVGPRKDSREALCAYLDTVVGITVVGNPDVRLFSFDVLGVDDGRIITDASGIKALSGHRFIIVEANFLTREAQNALLKSLEEPLPGTFFFFIVPQLDTVLPTIRSRVAIHLLVDSQVSGENETRTRAETFLKAPIAKRMKMIKEFTTEISDEEKSKADVIVFLAELERLLCENQNFVKRPKVLADIAMVKKYLADRAPSVKMLLEHVALSLG